VSESELTNRSKAPIYMIKALFFPGGSAAARKCRHNRIEAPHRPHTGKSDFDLWSLGDMDSGYDKDSTCKRKSNKGISKSKSI
jgi:hypothetical protein